MPSFSKLKMRTKLILIVSFHCWASCIFRSAAPSKKPALPTKWANWNRWWMFGKNWCAGARTAERARDERTFIGSKGASLLPNCLHSARRPIRKWRFSAPPEDFDPVRYGEDSRPCLAPHAWPGRNRCQAYRHHGLGIEALNRAPTSQKPSASCSPFPPGATLSTHSEISRWLLPITACLSQRTFGRERALLSTVFNEDKFTPITLNLSRLTMPPWMSIPMCSLPMRGQPERVLQEQGVRTGSG